MEMKNPHVIWAAVAIVIVMMSGAVILVLNNKDLGDLLAVAALIVVPVLSALGVATYQKLEQVKDHVNGNRSEDMKMIKELQETVKNLALRVIPPEEEGKDQT